MRHAETMRVRLDNGSVANIFALHVFDLPLKERQRFRDFIHDRPLVIRDGLIRPQFVALGEFLFSLFGHSFTLHSAHFSQGGL